MRNPPGSGSVVKIKGKYLARWTIAGRIEYGQSRATWEEADFDRVNSKPLDDAIPSGEIPSFQEWAYRQQSGNYGKRIAPGTHNTNESIRLNNIEGTPFGKKRLDKITRTDCQTWVDGIRKSKIDWVETPSGKRRRVLTEVDPSPAWVRRCAAFASKLFTLAIRDGLRPANPMSGVDLPIVPERENRTLAPEEAAEILKGERRIDAIMVVAMGLGIRKSELLRLAWVDVSREKAVIRVTKLKGGHKANKRRVVPMPSAVWKVIMAQPKRGALVFCTDSGKPLSPRNVARDYNARKAQVGLPAETRLQDLRGTFVSLLFEQGEDPRKVMELVGHTDPRTTFKMYARSRTSEKEAAVYRLFERIEGAAKHVDEHVDEKAQG